MCNIHVHVCADNSQHVILIVDLHYKNADQFDTDFTMTAISLSTNAHKESPEFI